VRSRRAYVAAIEERARRAEETREEEARRRVVEERLRIARELHDVVAHRMAVINVQAAAAAHLLQTDPTAAATSMEHVRASASTVLEELGSLLHVLRRGDEDTPLEPSPTLADLGALIASFAPSGLVVDRRDEGNPPALPESLQVTVYRLVQEALTNAHRYGDGRAGLTIVYEPEALRLEIANRPGAIGRSAAGTGLGLVGMDERVAAAGGTISHGLRDDGMFVVQVRLPVRSPVAS
jgi:signal transduction histidine kinase